MYVEGLLPAKTTEILLMLDNYRETALADAIRFLVFESFAHPQLPVACRAEINARDTVVGVLGRAQRQIPDVPNG